MTCNKDLGAGRVGEGGYGERIEGLHASNGPPTKERSYGNGLYLTGSRPSYGRSVISTWRRVLVRMRRVFRADTWHTLGVVLVGCG